MHGVECGVGGEAEGARGGAGVRDDDVTGSGGGDGGGVEMLVAWAWRR